jgi:Flp pilus assembly protein TadD
MTGPLRDWLLFPLRRPGRALVAAGLLALAGWLAWYGLAVLRFRQERAAAEQALAAYDFAAARRHLAECRRLWPADRDACLLAARAARRDGDLDAAEERLTDFRRLGGPTAAGTLEGDLLEAARGRVEAVTPDLLRELDAHHPASEEILEALAVGCVRVYRLDRARFWVEELLARFPRNPVGRLLRAETFETLGQRERALEEMRRLVADFPASPEARRQLAALLVQAQDYEGAAGGYEELLRLQPGRVEDLVGLTRCLMRLGRTEDARRRVQELQERAADNSEALLECGRFALADLRPADAEALLRRAAELAPDDHEVHQQLGVCLQQLDRPDEARAHLERSRQIEADLVRLERVFQAVLHAPADPAPRLEAGQICLRNGQEAEGLRWLVGALEVAPDHRPTHAALADYYAARGDAERAEYHRRLAR